MVILFYRCNLCSFLVSFDGFIINYRLLFYKMLLLGWVILGNGFSLWKWRVLTSNEDSFHVGLIDVGVLHHRVGRHVVCHMVLLSKLR
jgi:hypothetical protein